jgi:hypothetical protein
MNLKKLENYLRVNLLGPGPSSYKKIIYRAAVSQRLGNTGLDNLYSTFFLFWCVPVSMQTLLKCLNPSSLCILRNPRMDKTNLHGQGLAELHQKQSSQLNFPSRRKVLTVMLREDRCTCLSCTFIYYNQLNAQYVTHATVHTLLGHVLA